MFFAKIGFMNEFEILLFYKYIYLENPEEVAKGQRELQAKFKLKGRTIIAREGINATVEGTKENIAGYAAELLSDRRFADVHFKRSPGTGEAFPKTYVKVRQEIVTLGLGSGCDINPNVLTGKRLKPEELHEWIKVGREFYIIDMRNAYEHLAGHFKGSVLPPMENFRDLPKFIDSISHLKNRTVLTVCTGGVRCEKASGYLLSQGFMNVYQLDGGIVSYMEKYPNEDFMGKLYVFDNRIIMGFYTDDPKHEVVGVCSICAKPCERFTNCFDPECHRQVIACAECELAEGSGFLCKEGCKEEALLAKMIRQPEQAKTQSFVL
jgi:UPF0176 protein